MGSLLRGSNQMMQTSVNLYEEQFRAIKFLNCADIFTIS
jgi:hypothetical protein